MTYRSDLEALEARHAALDAEVTRQTVERDRARSLLEDAKTRLRLPVLDDVRVASPCTAAWDAMVGDDQVRHCASCDKDVFNLSGMTREDAEAVITAANGKLCVRYFRRSDGTILTADCPVGRRRARRRKLVVAGVTVMVAAAGAIGYAATRPIEQAQGGVDSSMVGAIPERVAPSHEFAKPPPPPIEEVKGDPSLPPTAPPVRPVRHNDHHVQTPQPTIGHTMGAMVQVKVK